MTVGWVSRASLLAVACSLGCSSGEPGPEVDQDDSTEEELSVRQDGVCVASSRVSAYLKSGACEPVRGRGGVWQAAPTFDALRESPFCTFRWSTSSRARPDITALGEALPLAKLQPVCRREKRCVEEDGESCLGTGQAYVREVTPTGPMAISPGCDVCGLVRDGHLWVVLPDDAKYRLPNGKYAGEAFLRMDDKVARVRFEGPPRVAAFRVPVPSGINVRDVKVVPPR